MNAPVTLPYENADQQSAAATLGVWVFLATEVLFFGGLVLAYSIYRMQYSASFVAASNELNVWSGAIMTGVLLLGSLLIAVCDTRARNRDSDVPRPLAHLLIATALLGACFLAIEFHEYHQLINEGRFPGMTFKTDNFSQTDLEGLGVELFFVLFFCMTGLHAIHMTLGIALVSFLAVMVSRTESAFPHRNLINGVALYWHFVDIVWVFLYPLFYLVR